jgi:hypothetical protein
MERDLQRSPPIQGYLTFGVVGFSSSGAAAPVPT